MSVKGKILMSVNPLIAKITESQLRNDIPDFRAGDSVRVHARIVEGSRERIQILSFVIKGYKKRNPATTRFLTFLATATFWDTSCLTV